VSLVGRGPLAGLSDFAAAAPGLPLLVGVTTRFFFFSTTTFFVRPWLKLCLTVPEDVVRVVVSGLRPPGLFVSVSFVSLINHQYQLFHTCPGGGRS